MQRRGVSRLLSLLLTLAFVFGAAWALLHWQDIFDWWRLRNYQPPVAIARLADSTTMQPLARRLFYVHYPELDDKEAFNQHCNNGEVTIVLGCYISARGIYLYNVQDSRLQGVEEVTAAHEMLHAAYDRLSTSERKRIDVLTAQAFARLDDKRIKDTIEQYRLKDPSVVPNELHSILATEAKNLPPGLEAHYKKYFTDRAQVVAYSEKYESEFTKRKNQIVVFDAQLNSLKSQIEAAEANLDRQTTSLADERKQLDALLAGRNVGAYNAGVDTYNTHVREYNVLIAATQAKIKQYNQLVNERNALALEEQDLVKALDSRIQPQTTQ